MAERQAGRHPKVLPLGGGERPLQLDSHQRRGEAAKGRREKTKQRTRSEKRTNPIEVSRCAATPARRLLQASRGECTRGSTKTHAAIERSQGESAAAGSTTTRGGAAPDSAADMADWSLRNAVNSIAGGTTRANGWTGASRYPLTRTPAEVDSWAWARHDDACGSKVGRSPEHVLRCGASLDAGSGAATAIMCSQSAGS